MNRKRRITITVLLTILLAFSAMPAQAHEAVDLTRTDCRLTIAMNYGGQPVAGGDLTIYRVGDVVEDDGNFEFAWKPELHCASSAKNPESAEVANDVLNCVKRQKLEGTTVTIDRNGQATFSNLGVGLYLIEQKTAADGYTAIRPFLISVPRWEDNHYNYAVNATAKAELHKETTPPNPPEPRTPPELPYTGQLYWPIPILLVLGAIFLAVGRVMRRRSPNA